MYLYLYLKRLPLKKRLLLDTVRTWLDFSNLPVTSQKQNIINFMFFVSLLCIWSFNLLVEGLILHPTLPQMLTGLWCTCKICQDDLSVLKQDKIFYPVHHHQKSTFYNTYTLVPPSDLHIYGKFWLQTWAWSPHPWVARWSEDWNEGQKSGWINIISILLFKKSRIS